MNTLTHTLIVAGSVLVVYGNALADDPTPEPLPPAASALTRQQVIEAMREARLMGEMDGNDIDGPLVAARDASAGPLSRATVRAQLRWSIQLGALHAFTGEDSGSFQLAAQVWRDIRATRLAATRR
jgi:hypothetical protein